MNSHSSTRRHCRRGFCITELLIAVAVAITTMVGATQLMYHAARQYQRLSSQQLLAQEAANIMEDLMSRPWESITSSEPPQVGLSTACQQIVPAAKLRVTIEPESIGPDTGEPEARRITIEIDSAGEPLPMQGPVRLVAWRFQDREVTP